MERQLAKIETITALDPIPGADKIECATVAAWKIVVKRGVFAIGDSALFLEIDSLLPNRPWSSFLFKDTRALYRLKTVKLKGQISQGLLVPVAEVPELAAWDRMSDLAAHLGISKWEPEIAANLAGQVKGNFPSFLRKSDEERLQNCKSVLEEIRDILIYVATKMDGTSFTAYKYNGVFGVCSRNLELREEGGSDYWDIAKKLDLPAKLPEGYSISAELCGPGIQKNKMGLSEKKLYVFNVWDIVKQKYLDFEDFQAFVRDLGLETVPIIADEPSRPQTVEEWLDFAGKQRYSNGSLAEGIVVRSMNERYSEALRGRLSFKVISNEFLLKYGE